jgi:hypothetical protein
LKISVLATLLILVAAGSGAQTDPERPPAIPDPVGTAPSRHQDSVRLTRTTSAVIPADGLWSVGLGASTYSTVYPLNGFLQRISQNDVFLMTEVTPWSWLNLWAELPWRKWSDGTDYVPASGSGLGDGRWLGTIGLPLKGGLVHLAVTGGGNIPVGDEALGLAEGVFSPRAGAALTFRFWTDNMVPEMRLHLNVWQRWNQAEDTGYGMGDHGFQPWPPRYQSAAVAGGTDRNDALALSGGLEFRKGTTSLWLEYSWEDFRGNETVSRSEQLRMVGAGLRWGVSEGWALHGNYLVSLADAEARYIRRVLELTGWMIGGRGGAAEILDLPASTLRSRMKKLGIARNT